MFKDGEAKELFGITELMRDLIRTWVPLPWAPHVEVSSMQQLSTEHVSEGHDEAGRLTHRHGDVAWLVEVSGATGAAGRRPGAPDAAQGAGGGNPADGGSERSATGAARDPGEQPERIGGPGTAETDRDTRGPADGAPNTLIEPLCSVLVMLEVQNEPMASMPLRMLEYVSMAMSRSFKQHGMVTPVLPVVLYTGRREWHMPQAVRPMIHRPDLVGDRFTPDMSYLLLELGTLPLPAVEHMEALNLATELVRVSSRATLAELAQALERLMMVAEVRGEQRAVDAMASRLALSLARKHGHDAMGRKVDNMQALVSVSKEWLYKPGLGELLEDERQLRQEALDRLEELERMREKEQRMREKEQRTLEQKVNAAEHMREKEQRMREKEQRMRENEQRRMLRRLDASLTREAVEALEADEVARRLDALLGDDD